MIATDQVIKEIGREVGEPGFHNYTLIQGYMLDAIRDLNIFTMPCWSVKTLPITAYNTYNWPCDCVKPLLSIIQRGNQRFLLSVSDDILETQIPDSQPSDDEVDTEDLLAIDGFVNLFGWNIWNWGLGEVYGAQTMLPPWGVVIHDKTNRQSYIKRFRLKTGDQIICMYKSDGLSDCPEYFPVEAKERVEYFILQKYFRIRNPNLAESMRIKYKEEDFRLQRFLSDDGEEAWIRAMNSNITSSPKI